jgi:protein-tyrosine phosphatase
MNRVVPSLANFMDLGGRITPLGHFKKGVYFRSGNLAYMDHKYLDLLYALGVRHIIDLRSQRAKARDRSKALDDPRFDVHELLIHAGESIPDDRAGNVKMYETMFASHEEIGAILKLIVSLGPGVLIHCSAGKDRTGAICAILLGIAGCSEEEINENYLWAYGDLDRHVAWLKTQWPNLGSFYYTPDPTLLPEVLKGLKRVYGTTDAYLKAIGLSEKDIATIRGNMFGN